MGAIIAQLLAMFGPLLMDFLSKWLESLFNRTAKKLPMGATKSDLIQASLDATPRRQIVRRNILRFIKDHQNETKLTPAMKKEFSQLSIEE